ncbi:metallophosphoesterase [Desemzia sp. RIT804]|uniref:metallophosphoesterase n=1 Tax=Desemzia sp. RIT 804 TaxID=2810209 RepID=UPI001952784B|nr:metallophosphoesterase [Desemzia sp. RIT 804]MBM6613330.1 metallophosphoesterase [Desemzia sp. RIT 804]
MKILVVSDSHGDRDVLVELKELYQNKMDRMFHCGDSELEATDEIWDSFVTVKGNMDFDEQLKLEQVVEVGNERFFMVHGHYHDVKVTMVPLLNAAKEANAHFAFFGHSHELGVEKKEGILLLNPGSILQPRGRYNIKTYAIIDIEEKGITVSYYDREHQLIDDLVVHFARS